MEKLKVLFASAEAVPFAKTGGLADVAGSLPLALADLGADVRLIMPKYHSVKVEGDRTAMDKNVEVWFVENDDYFDRTHLYGDRYGDYADNLDRFSFFSRQVLERCLKENFKPDIIHCNDWHTALVPVYLNTLFKYDPFFSKTRTLFTIHNIAYQGLFAKEEFPKIGLDWALFHIHYFEFYGKVNLMKAGIVYSDAVSTVSPSYAKEILTPEYGCGLEGVLKTRADSLFGILNGIDYSTWNPATDKDIAKNYSVENLDDKYLNKEDLQKQLGLKVDADIPMIGMISRLADQKGMDIFARIIGDVLNKKVQLVMLGSGDQKYHVLLEKMARAHPRNASINLRFDMLPAGKIYAASDIFLIPSRYEPCGLNQMIGFKYGAIPVARKTGGLKDTIHEFDPKTRKGSGFLFVDYKPEALLDAINKALATYQRRELWRALVKNVMELDFSWKVSAREYIRLYQKIVKRPPLP
ncbi:MAG: glycogen synthase GlgA [Candidatus Omnitrophica bacterium]|nr:glycogen synthase GlgA [Candidatus Omnitrophota bacterium]